MTERGHKKEKFEERILAELNSLLRTRISDKRLQFVSITKVELNADYSEAKVYWDTFNGDLKEDAKQGMKAVSGKMRSHLAQVIKVRHVPNLEFLYDSQFESEREIEDLLAEEAKKGRSY